jgi:hypothetical protein
MLAACIGTHRNEHELPPLPVVTLIILPIPGRIVGADLGRVAVCIVYCGGVGIERLKPLYVYLSPHKLKLKFLLIVP